MRQRPSFPVRLNLGAPAGAGRDTRRVDTPATAPQGLGLDSAVVRTRMVERLLQREALDPRVAQALRQVERHRFVDSALVIQAYEDTSLPIGLGQTISKPSVVARMLSLLMQAPALASGAGGRVLEIGTGCGYQAMLLSHLVSEVYSVERLRGLHDKARENLKPFRRPHLHLVFGDGMLGLPASAPYAGIISAAGGDAVPAAWLNQLMMGGRILAPKSSATGQQSLVLIEKTPQGLVQTVLETVNFVPLKSGIA